MAERLPISPPKNPPDSKRTTRCVQAANVRAFNLVPLNSFNGLQLPSKSDVLRRFFSMQDSYPKNTQKRHLARQILTETIPIYNKVPCSMKPENKSLDLICSLFDQYRANQKNPYELSPKVASFKKELSQLCDFTHVNAENDIRNDRLRTDAQKNDDLNFLLDQKTERKMYFSLADNNYNAKYNIRESRLERSIQRQISVQVDQAQTVSLESFAQHAVPSTSSAIDTDYKPPSTSGRTATDDSSQKKFLKDPRVLSVLDRTNTSSRSAVSVLGATAAALGKDIDECILNR